MAETADGPGTELPGNAVEAGRDTSHQRLWERYMEIERRELEDRKNGELGKVLGSAMAGESQEDLDRMAREDRERAERGLVELVEDGTVVYKRIDDLALEDRAGRIKAQKRRLAWVGERLGMPPGPT